MRKNIEFILDYKLITLIIIVIFLSQCSLIKRPKRKYFPKEDLPIIPYPKNVHYKNSSLKIDTNITIVYSSTHPLLKQEAEYIKTHLQNLTSKQIYISASKNSINTPLSIYLQLSNKKQKQSSENYTLDISGSGRIEIKSNNRAGIFYGIQTLFQLFPAEIYSSKSHSKSNLLSIPQVKIDDHPRFDIRIVHLDLAQKYLPLSFIKKYIDYLAYHKINTLHLTLANEKNWNLEIKKYPELTPGLQSSASKYIKQQHSVKQLNRKKYYTQKEIKELIQYAQEKYITIIPEINLLGSNKTISSTYPDLTCNSFASSTMPKDLFVDQTLCRGQEKTLDFIEDISNEVIQLFPSNYIHFGENNISNRDFNNCPHCKNKIDSLGFKSPSELNEYFLGRIKTYVNSQNRKTLKWDNNSNYLISRQFSNQNLNMGPSLHQPLNEMGFSFPYISFNSPEKLKLEKSTTLSYLNNIYNNNFKRLKQKGYNIRGVGALLSTDNTNNTKQIESDLLPNLSAFSEVVWSSPNSGWYNFLFRLKEQYRRYNQMKAHFKVPKPRVQDMIILQQPSQISINRPISIGKIHYNLNDKELTHLSPVYKNPIKIDSSTRLKTALFMTDRQRSEITSSYIIIKNQAPKSMRYGLKYKYYENISDNLKEIENFSPLYTGYTYTFDIKKIKKRNNNFSIKFSGLLNISQKGEYTFYVTSDNGSKLVIDNIEVTNIQNFTNNPIKGSINLSEGLHPITIYYNEKAGGERLDIRYSGPNFEPKPIPPWKFLTKK